MARCKSVPLLLSLTDLSKQTYLDTVTCKSELEVIAKVLFVSLIEQWLVHIRVQHHHFIFDCKSEVCVVLTLHVPVLVLIGLYNFEKDGFQFACSLKL